MVEADPVGTQAAAPTDLEGQVVMHRDQHPQHLNLYLPAFGPTIKTASRLALESMVVPYVLIFALLHTRGLSTALLSALGWSVLVLLLRWKQKGRLPGTLILTGGLLLARVGISLATGSAFIYLLQPIIGSVIMAAIFVGSSLLGRPLTLSLAKDFIDLPAHMLARPRVRRMFRNVGLFWGATRLIDAGVSFGFLHLSVDYGMLSRGLVSPVLLALSIGACVWLGRRGLASDNIRLARRPAVA
jgi:intracellular septation protein A